MTTPFNTLDALQLIVSTPDKRPCLVEDLLLSTGVSMLTAKPKTGKSTFARQLAVAVAHGRTFLGHETQQSDVLYLNLEGPVGVVADHFRRLGYTETKSKIHVVDERMPHNADDGLKKLSLTLAAIPSCKLVVIDPVAKFLRAADSNSYDEVSLAIERLEAIAKAHAVHVMMLTHSKKRLTEDVGDSPLGSTGFRGGTDTNIFITKQGADRIISTEQRWGVAIEPTLLVFDQATGEMNLGPVVADVEETQRRSRERKTRDRIATDLLATIAELQSPTQKDVLDKVTGKTVSKLEVLAELVECGMLMQSGTGAKADPLRYQVRREVVQQ